MQEKITIDRFEVEKGQLVCINLVGGLIGDRSPDPLPMDSFLITIVGILLNSNSEIIVQQPEQSHVANALIRINLPMTGAFDIWLSMP